MFVPAPASGLPAASTISGSRSVPSTSPSIEPRYPATSEPRNARRRSSTALGLHAMGLVKRLNVVYLYVRDLDRSLAFYRDVLGIPIERDAHNPDWAEARFPDGVRFALHPWHEGVPEIGSGSVMIDFEVEDLDEALARLREAGVEVASRCASLGQRLQLRRPDGYRIDLSAAALASDHGRPPVAELVEERSTRRASIEALARGDLVRPVERPDRQHARDSAVAARPPERLVDTGAGVRRPREDEEQVGEPVQVREHERVELDLLGGEQRLALGAAAERAGDVQPRRRLGPAGQDEAAQLRQLGVEAVAELLERGRSRPGRRGAGR